MNNTFVIATLLAALTLSLASASPEDLAQCHHGYWKKVTSTDEDCSIVDYLHIDVDSLKMLYAATVCETGGERTIYVPNNDFYNRTYSTSDSEFVCLEDSGYWEGRGTYNCEGDTLKVGGACLDGDWTRLSGDEETAIKEIFELTCNDYWSECTGDL